MKTKLFFRSFLQTANCLPIIFGMPTALLLLPAVCRASWVVCLLLILCPMPFALSQTPKGFNYQAVIRDGVSGNPITTPVDVRFTIQSDSLGGSVFWVEEHYTVDPNDNGMITVVIGKGTRISGLAKFQDIDWTVTPKFIMTHVNSGGWKLMGSSRLWSVPYAMVADSLGGPLKKLSVKGATLNMEEALFEVKNISGQTVFAVYNEGVRVYVDNGSKGSKGGFAVSGFGAEKDALSDKYLFVSRDSVRVWLDTNPATKVPKGGFSVGGYDITKGKNQNLLAVSNDSIRIYINDQGKAAKGGFSVGGFTGTKGSNNFLNIATDASGIINPAVNRIVWYPLKNAFLAGRVYVASATDVGENSFASGYEGKAKGMYSQAMGYKPQAMGNYSTSIGKNSVANNDNSFAFGDAAKALNQDAYSFGAFTEAQGIGSFAFGYVGRDSLGPTGTITKAVGNYSFAMGLGAQTGATAEGAFAIGPSATANGKFSLAMGYKSTASEYYSVAIGQYASASGQSSVSIHGSATGLRSVSIGDLSYASGTSSVAIGGFFYHTTVPDVTNNHKAAASGARSVAIGNGVGALGDYSVSIGNGTYGDLVIPPAVTYGKAEADHSFSIGTNNLASASYAFAIGTTSDAEGTYAFSIGYNANTSGSNSYAIGRDVTSTGNYAFALGRYTTAQAYNSFVIGRYNVIEGSTSTWTDNEPLFVIGNGSSTSARSNAFSVRKDGLTETGGTLRVAGWDIPPSTGAGVEISYLAGGLIQAYDRTAGTQMPLSVYSGNVRPIADNTYYCGNSSNRWTAVYAVNGAIQTSDIRKKDDIRSLCGGLETVAKLNPVTFLWKDQESAGRHTGLIAQEVLPLLPEVVDVGDDPDKTLGINYAGLVPVLINAIQEQQKQIDELKALVSKLYSEK